MKLFSSLTREQKEAVGLLQIGTFLEDFDLMLYVHMAVLLNNVFFPATDPKTAGLLSAFAFSSTFVLRPFGALLFGYIGDKIGRKPTVIITSVLMAISCIIMANVPTYAQVGIIASWIVTGCRMLQGVSSISEIIGAEIYLTEMIKPPARYPIVALLDVAANIGQTVALGVAALVTTFGLNWRSAFWFGAVIAIVGFVARTRLRETPDFIDMQRKMRKLVENMAEDGANKASELLERADNFWKQNVSKKTSLALFLITCAYPVFFYFNYIYCGNFLMEHLHYTGEEVIKHNFILAFVEFASMLIFALSSYKYHPLELLKLKLVLLIPLVLFIPCIFFITTTPYMLLFMQCWCVFFAPTDAPATPVFIMHFPVFKRFTFVNLTYALSRALVYIVTSFGLVFITTYLNFWGLWIIIIPVLVGFGWGLYHFITLEPKDENYVRTFID